MALDMAMTEGTDGGVARLPKAGRIAFVIGSLTLGGAERVVATLAAQWVDQGHDVAIISFASAEDDFFRTDPRIERVWLNSAGDSGGVAMAVAANARRLARLRAELSRLKPDVAIAFMTEANVLLALASIGLGIRTLGSERNYPPLAKVAGPWRLARRFTYALLDAVVAQTNGAADWIRRNTNAREISVIPNAISLPLHRAEPIAPVEIARAFRPGAKIVLCVGRLCETKRFDRAIDAFAEVEARHPDWILVLLGDGALRAELEALAARRGVSDRVLFLGAASNPGDWHQAADIFLLTSAHEGYPNALLEAMAHGRACISMDCPEGPRELIDAGRNGLLASDEAELAHALDACMSDAPLRARLGRAAAGVLETNAAASIMRRWEAQLALPAWNRPIASPVAETIVFVVSGMGHGGAERVAANLCNHWAEHGREVTLVITFSGRGPSIYPLHPRVSVQYLSDEDSGRDRSPWGKVRRLARLRRLIRTLRPTRVYAFMTLVSVAVLAATRGLGSRVIVSERTYPPAQRLPWALRLARRLTYPWADTVVMQTGQGAEWMARACPTAHVLSIPNPLTADLAQAGPLIRPDDVLGGSTRRMLLAAGRLSDEKQFPLLVDAFRLLAADMDDLDLVILGDGSERSEIARRAASHGLEERVRLPGHVGNMTDWYARADAFVLTSQREGFPNALMEALAFGVPAVSFDCATGPRDLIEHGVNGFLVPPSDGPKGIADAVRKVAGLDPGDLSLAAARLRERLRIEAVASDWLRA
jgi:glycosyltransferase involved in cell wall biosynthesis